MQNVWDLQVVMDPKYNKPKYQPCTVVVTWADDVANINRNGTYVDYQKCFLLGQGNAQMNASIAHQKGAPGFLESQCNIPIECEVKVENDNSQHSVNGKKYTVKLERFSQSGSGGATQQAGRGASGGGGYSSAPADPTKDTKIQMLAVGKMVAPWVAAGIITKDQFGITVSDIDATIDLLVKAKCSPAPDPAPNQAPQQGDWPPANGPMTA